MKEYLILEWVAVFFQILMLALNIAFQKKVFLVFMLIFFVLVILMNILNYLTRDE